MPIRLSASGRCRLFCCIALGVAVSSSTADDASPSDSNPPEVTVEMWLLDAALDKMDEGGIALPCPIDLRAVFTSPEKLKACDAQVPGGVVALLPNLQSKGVIQVLAQPKLVVSSGQRGKIETGNLKFEAAPVVTESGRMRVEYRAEYRQVTGPVRRGTPAGESQRVAAFTVDDLESGKLFLVGGDSVRFGPKPALERVVLARATRIGLKQTTAATVNSPVALGKYIEIDGPAATTGQAAPKAANRPAPKKLLVELKVVEVNLVKMKKLGFEWSQIAGGECQAFSVESLNLRIKGQAIPGEQLNGFLEALVKNGLARIIAEPTLVTLDGRPACLSVGTTQLDTVPIVLESGRVKLECRLKAGDADLVTADTELELGKTCLLRNAGISDRANAANADTETFVLARVELLASGRIATIAGPPIDVEVREQNR